MLPRVIVHVAISADGRTDGFEPDIATYYRLIAQWREDATLAGSDTLLHAHQGEDAPGECAPDVPADPSDSRPLLVVPDSRGRVRSWATLRAAGYWRDFISLGTRQTPAQHWEYLKRQRVTAFAEGEHRVDLHAALTLLYDRFGVRTVRVDSGGTLNGALLRAGLVDEVSLLVHPVLVGGASPQTSFRAADLAESASATALVPLSADPLGDGLLWLRYRVVR